MANAFTTLGFVLPEVGADTDFWGGHNNSDWQLADALFQRFIGTTTTRLLQFNVNAVSTTTTRTVTWQDADVSFPSTTTAIVLVDTSAAQTLSNKTLTSSVLGSGVTGFPTATGAQTFASANIPTATVNVFSTGGPSTGPIGAAGETWLIEAGTTYVNSSPTNMTATIRIFDGTVDLQSQSGSAATGFNIPLTVSVRLTLSAATTFTLQGTDNVGGNQGGMQATVTNGAANKGTWIRATRQA